MKPIGPVARREDYLVARIAHASGAALIREHHYARGCSNTGIMHGLFRAGALVGVAHWLPPTRVCAESVAGAAWRKVLSLSRLVVLPSEPQNCATLLMAASIRLLPAAWEWLVTYADESQGHRGIIYLAGGWSFVGKTKPEARWIDANGRQVSRKSGPTSRTAEEMARLGHALAGRWSKLKFVRHLKRRARAQSSLALEVA